MRSILNIGFSTRVPQQKGSIPFGYYANGAPFLIKSQSDVDSLKIVCLKTRKETDISLGYIQEDADKEAKFYTASHDLGVPNGDYFYKMILGGVVDNVLKGQTDVTASVYFQQNNSVGSWEYTIEDLINDPLSEKEYIYTIISDTNDLNGDSYFLLVAPGSNLIRLVKSPASSTAVVLFSTDYNYLQTGVSYTIKIERDVNYVFTGYIKGGAFGSSYVLIDVTNGEGTNPITDNEYTTSSYSLITLGYEAYILNPKTNGNIVDLTSLNPNYGVVQKYTTITGGSTLYSQVFRIDENMRLPDPEVGDYNQDYNDDYDNFEASGVLDENGEPI